MVHEIFGILLDTLNTICIGSEYKDAEHVKMRLRRLNFNYIQYVMNFYWKIIAI